MADNLWKQSAVKALIRANEKAGLTTEQQKELVCTLVGHSRIVKSCFGQVTCGRCDAIVGDQLMGSFDTKDKVIIDHNCEKCRDNFLGLTWRDTFMTPNPFPSPP